MPTLDFLILGFVSVGIFIAQLVGLFRFLAMAVFAYAIALLVIVNAGSIEHYIHIIIRNPGGERTILIGLLGLFAGLVILFSVVALTFLFASAIFRLLGPKSQSSGTKLAGALLVLVFQNLAASGFYFSVYDKDRNLWMRWAAGSAWAHGLEPVHQAIYPIYRSILGD